MQYIHSRIPLRIKTTSLGIFVFDIGGIALDGLITCFNYTSTEKFGMVSFNSHSIPAGMFDVVVVIFLSSFENTRTFSSRIEIKKPYCCGNRAVSIGVRVVCNKTIHGAFDITFCDIHCKKKQTYKNKYYITAMLIFSDAVAFKNPVLNRIAKMICPISFYLILYFKHNFTFFLLLRVCVTWFSVCRVVFLHLSK